MRKYIDVEKFEDKLIEIEERHTAFCESVYDNAYSNCLNEVKLIINSLQQEQPELHPIGDAEACYQKGFHDGLIKGRMEILKELEDIERRKAEPILIIKEQELPEVVLEKEIDKEINMERKKLIEVFGPMNGEQSLAISKFAHRIYALGLKARNL